MIVLAYCDTVFTVGYSKDIVHSDSDQTLFLNTVSDLGFQQFVDSPTRGENILDIVLCNDPLLIADIAVNEPFSASDHGTVTFLLNTSESDFCSLGGPVIVDPGMSTCRPEGFDADHSNRSVNWGKADWDGLGKFYSGVDWTLCVSASNGILERSNEC